jgi:hypothetical protein
MRNPAIAMGLVGPCQTEQSWVSLKGYSQVNLSLLYPAGIWLCADACAVGWESKNSNAGRNARVRESDFVADMHTG